MGREEPTDQESEAGTVRINVYLDPDLAALLRAAARRDRRSLSGEVAYIVGEYLARQIAALARER